MCTLPATKANEINTDELTGGTVIRQRKPNYMST
jgi:hypothetical protein